MCNFLSGITKKDGEMLINPFLDNHTELEEFFGLVDNGKENYVKWELTPNKYDYCDIASYIFVIDEDRRPDWCDDVDIERKARAYLKNLYYEDKKDLILVSQVAILKNCTVKWARGAVIKSASNTQIEMLYDNSQVGVLHNHTRVGELYDNSQVVGLYDYSQVGGLHDNAQVGQLFDNAQIIK